MHQETARKYLELINSKLLLLKAKWMKYTNEKQIEWDDDVYSDTILKVYEKILQDGITDESESGMLNYLFKAFMMNIKRDKQYSRNAYRDNNIDASDELDKQFNGEDELELKIRRNVYDDWAVVYLLQLVEKKFDSLSFYCFRLYYIIPKMTYEKLREITKVKDCKKRVVTIKKWLKENVTKQELEGKFIKYYDND